MASTTQFFRAKMRRACRLGRNGTGLSDRAPLAGRQYLLIAAVILIGLASPSTGLSGDTTEYCSTDTPLAIPDYDTVISELNISDAGKIFDMNVRVDITHGWDGNLDVFLIAPDGTRVELFTDVGRTDANFDNTILDDEAAESIADGSAPFRGSYRPHFSPGEALPRLPATLRWACPDHNPDPARAAQAQRRAWSAGAPARTRLGCAREHSAQPPARRSRGCCRVPWGTSRSSKEDRGM